MSTENQELTKVIIVEQVIGSSQLSTYNLNMTYSNHKDQFDKFKFSEELIEKIVQDGVAQRRSKNTQDEDIMLTVIKSI